MQEGTGWGGATLPGSPPTLATTPFGSQAMPSQPLGAPGLFHRAGRGEGGREGGALGQSRARSGAWGRGAEVGKTPSWDPRARLAMEPGLGVGVMNRGRVIINQKKKKIIK